MLELQRSIGNRRTAALLTRRPRALARQGAVMNAVWGTIEEATFAGVRSHFAAAIDPDIAAAGQFQFTLLIAAKVQPVFDAMATEKWADDGERTQAVAAVDGVRRAALQRRLQARGRDAQGALGAHPRREVTRGGEARAVPRHGGRGGLRRGGEGLPGALEGGKGKPDVSARLTLAHLFAFRRWEAQACKATASYAAGRFARSGKTGGKRSPATSIPETVLTVKRTRNLTESAPKEWVGDVLTYRDDLHAIVDKMARALDDGWTIHVRVLSGSVGTDEEHSVLVIGHHQARAFFFFDPDVYGSDLATLGYGRFYFNKEDNLLTTARDRGDLTVWDADVAWDTGAREGWHASSGRHRYQAMRLWTE